MSRALDLGEAKQWARARGEQVVLSDPRGFSFGIGVLGWSLSLSVHWALDGRETVELWASLPTQLSPEQLLPTAEKVLEVNRLVAPQGVSFTVAGDVGVSARAVLYLDEGRVSSDAFAAGLHALRRALLEHAPGLVDLGALPLNARYEEALRPGDHGLGRPLPPSDVRDAAALAALVPRLEAAMPPPGPVNATFGEGVVRLRHTLTPPLDPLTAARRSGRTEATSLWRDENGDFAAGVVVFTDAGGGCSTQSLARAWRSLVSDLAWVRSS